MQGMTPVKFLALRLYCITLGRFAWGSRLLRNILVRMLIGSKARGQRYNASSRFFDVRDLG
jgi:hypothetical protein